VRISLYAHPPGSSSILIACLSPWSLIQTYVNVCFGSEAACQASIPLAAALGPIPASQFRSAAFSPGAVSQSTTKFGS
jgi:hypothetical protein